MSEDVAAGKRKAAETAGKRSGSAPKKGSKQPRTTKQRLLSVLKWTVIAGVVLSLIAVGGFFVLYQSIDIPDPNEDFLTETTHVYYADGETDLGQFAIQERDAIDLDEMPDTVKDAVVAAENQSFWTDEGIDPKGILRAAFSNASSGNVTQGGSTITQQYVKILYLTQEQTWERKAKEAILSLKVENRLSKEEVLEGYLNTIYFGRGAYGVQAAAQAYFDVDAKDLDLRQSAVLASVLNNPTMFDPANGREAKRNLKERYEYVLGEMADTGAVEAEQAERAARRLPEFPEIEESGTYEGQKGHVLQMVRKELLRLGFSQQEIDGGGLEVTTTFTAKAMAAAKDGVLEARPDGFSDNELHIGVATVEPGTGAVRGIYGGQDYLRSQLNWAVEGGQAGSTFKPFALAAGIKSGFSLKDTFEGNSPLVLDDGSEVENQGDADYGSAVSLIQATEDSINTAYIDLTQSMEDGPQRIVDTAVDMGIPPAEPARPAWGFPTSSPGLEAITGVALGSQTVSPINMANAYATIANGGEAAEPYIIEKVVDADGETRYTHKVSTHRALSEDIAADVSYAMQQVVESGSGATALAGFPWPTAGKTGTATTTAGAVSSAWFAGFTAQLSTAVMYVRGQGNEQLQGWLPEYFGGSYPARTWRAVMTRDMEGLEPVEFPPPAYVDGEAPEEGHEPYTPPPPPKTTKRPEQSQEPSEPSEDPTTRDTEPSEEPSTQDTEPTEPTEPTQPTGPPTNTNTTAPGGGGGGGGGPGGNRQRRRSGRSRVRAG